MDPISLAIIGGLASGAAGATAAPAMAMLAEKYQNLKDGLKLAFGAGSDLAGALDGLENNPESDGRRAVLAEEMEKAGAQQNQEIVAAAQALLDAIKEQPGGEQALQIAMGNNIAQADRGSTATVNVNSPDKNKNQ